MWQWDKAFKHVSYWRKDSRHGVFFFFSMSLQQSVSIETTAKKESSVSFTPTSPPSASLPAGESRAHLKQTQGSNGKPPIGVWPQFPLSCVRIEPSTEFSSVGLSVQFGVDRLALTIRRKCTKIPYSKLQLVEVRSLGFILCTIWISVEGVFLVVLNWRFQLPS